jgi:Zn-dependent peptidase ImmA (M78 family)
VREDLWHALAEGGRRANRARSTIIHELAHVILHVQVLREAKKVQTREALLNRRAPRGELKPFRDPEWQAHALCGCILAPLRHIEMLKARGLGVDAMADELKVSSSFLKSRLRRLKIEL